MTNDDFMWAWVKVALSTPKDQTFGNGAWFGTDVAGIGGGKS